MKIGESKKMKNVGKIVVFFNTSDKSEHRLIVEGTSELSPIEVLNDLLSGPAIEIEKDHYRTTHGNDYFIFIDHIVSYHIDDTLDHLIEIEV